MGTMTYTQLATELGFLLGNRNDADATDTGRLFRWIDQAYNYMCHPSVHHFREMQAIGSQTLTSGTNSYSTASYSGVVPVAIRWVTYVDGTTITDPTDARHRLHPRSIRWLEERSNTTGRPRFYIVDGANLYTYPIPGTSENGNVLKVGFYREPDTLTGSDQTLVGAYFDRPLLKFAQAFAEADLGDRAKSLVTLKEAQGLLNGAMPESEMEAEDDGFQAEVILQPAMGF